MSNRRPGRWSENRTGGHVVGQILRVMTVAGVIASVSLFLIFVYSDSLVGRQLERRALDELRDAGLSRHVMRPTPVEGFTLDEEVRLDGDLVDIVVDHAEGTLWITDATGRILQLDSQTLQVFRVVVPKDIGSPGRVSLGRDGRLLVTDRLQGLVVYVDAAGATEIAYSMDGEHQGGLRPIAASESESSLVLLVSDVSPGVYLLADGWSTNIYPNGLLTDLVVDGSHIYVTGEHDSGLPVAKLTTAKVDLFADNDLSWAWALPYWDQPFVGLAVDEGGYITTVDRRGHLVQLSPSGRVLLQAPPQGSDFGGALAVAADENLLWVLHEQGLKRYRTNERGTRVRQAAELQSLGAYNEAAHLWERLVKEEPDLLLLRRWLGEAYVLSGNPQEAAKHLYLAGDDEGLEAAADAEAYRLRKESLWRVWWITMAATAVLWLMSKAWPALIGVGRLKD